MFTTWDKPALFQLSNAEFSFTAKDDVFNVVNASLNWIFVVWMYLANSGSSYPYYYEYKSVNKGLLEESHKKQLGLSIVKPYIYLTEAEQAGAWCRFIWANFRMVADMYF